LKAVLLAAGKGTRLLPISDFISKQMMPIAGKFLLEYIIEDLVDSGFDELCLVIGHLGHQIKDHFGNGDKFNAKIQYITQNEQLGTANALQYAKQFVGTDTFLVYLSDTIIPKGLNPHIKNILNDKSDVNILSANVPNNQISEVGTIQVEKYGYVEQINEKSQKSTSSLAWAGLGLFKSNFIFKMIETMQPSARGEYEITDAINKMITNRKKVKNHICSEFLDAGTSKGLKKTFNFILEQRHNDCCLGKQEFEKSESISPIHIGKNFQIGKNSIVGPMISIGNNVNIGNNVVLKDAIVLNDTSIESDQIISNCIISNHGKVILE